MNIIADTPDTRQTIATWCTEMLELRQKHATPIEAFDDPRVAALADTDSGRMHVWGDAENFAGAIDNGMAEYMGMVYFDQCVEKPAFPLPLPEWAGRWKVERTETEDDLIAVVSAQSEKIRAGGVLAVVERLYNVNLITAEVVPGDAEPIVFVYGGSEALTLRREEAAATAQVLAAGVALMDGNGS